MTLKLIITILLAISPSLAYAQDSIFKEADHCVAWRTSKKMFLVSKSSPVGMNCSITTKTKKNGNNYQLIVTVPIEKFDSGEPSRDEEVVHMLSGDKQPNLIIESEILSLKKIASLEKAEASVEGTILINGNQKPISIKIKSNRKNGSLVYQGSLKTSFTALGVEPPSLAAGIISKVYDELELHFQFQEGSITGHPKL